MPRRKSEKRIRSDAAHKGWETRRRREAERERALQSRRRSIAAKRAWKERKAREAEETRRRHAAAVKAVATRRRHVAERKEEEARQEQKRRVLAPHPPPPPEPELPSGIVHVGGPVYRAGDVHYMVYHNYRDLAKYEGELVGYRKSFADHEQAARWIKEIGVSGVFFVVIDPETGIADVWEIPS